MAVNDCFDENQFSDEPDGLLHMKFKPDGGLASDAGGVYVGFPPDAPEGYPIDHIFNGQQDLVVVGSVSSGIVSPGGAGPVSGIIDGSTVTNPYPRNVDVGITGSFNGVLLCPSSGASACLMHLSCTIDGVTYKRIHTIGYYGDGGGRAGYYSRQQRALFTAGPGLMFVPQFVINYEVVGAGADFLQAGAMQFDISIHTTT